VLMLVMEIRARMHAILHIPATILTCPPGRFFSAYHIHTRTYPFATREPLKGCYVGMFVINFRWRPLRDTTSLHRVSITARKSLPCILAKLHYAYLGVSPSDT